MWRKEKMFQVTIETDNAAFEEHGEVSRILRKLADKMELCLDTNGTMRNTSIGGKIFDLNGNKCGEYSYTPDDEDDDEDYIEELNR